jgi:hypothetical protein
MLPGAASESFDDQVRQCYLAGACPPALVQQTMTHGRTIADCLRSHGIPHWPDPTLGPQGRPFFDLSGQGITRSQSHSPQYEAMEVQCSRLANGRLLGLHAHPRRTHPPRTRQHYDRRVPYDVTRYAM